MEKRTKLDEHAEKARLENITKNSYKTGNEYNTNNINALSNGDDKGKGEYNGQIGSLTDINTRIENTQKNTYKKNVNEYNTNNINALSNGDDKGKGEYNGQIGSLTDINKRIELTVKNLYKEDKKYPDFTI